MNSIHVCCWDSHVAYQRKMCSSRWLMFAVCGPCVTSAFMCGKVFYIIIVICCPTSIPLIFQFHFVCYLYLNLFLWFGMLPGKTIVTVRKLLSFFSRCYWDECEETFRSDQHKHVSLTLEHHLSLPIISVRHKGFLKDRKLWVGDW